MRLLLIEDDTKLNHSLKYQLEKENFIVDACFDGEEALFYINQGIHDVILLDRMLPLLDGTELLTLMRRKNNSTPVILITALGTLNDKITGLDSGADDYLVKPFEFEELLARIRCVTRRSRFLRAAAYLSPDRPQGFLQSVQKRKRTFPVLFPQCRTDPYQRPTPCQGMGAGCGD